MAQLLKTARPGWVHTIWAGSSFILRSCWKAKIPEYGRVMRTDPVIDLKAEERRFLETEVPRVLKGQLEINGIKTY